MLRRNHRAGLLLATSAMACATPAAAGETVSYSYDSLGRLTGVSRSTSTAAVTAEYRYDAADNRTNVTIAVTGGAGSPVPSVLGGSFEAPEMGSGGYAYAPGGGPATFAGNSGIAGDGSAWGFAAAPDGDQVAFIQNGPTAATVSLPVSGLVPGASYKVSFRMSARPGYAAIPLTLAFNGTAIGTFGVATHGFVATTSPAFTATSSSGTLTFTGIATADTYTSGLDRVTVAPAEGQP